VTKFSVRVLVGETDTKIAGMFSEKQWIKMKQKLPLHRPCQKKITRPFEVAPNGIISRKYKKTGDLYGRLNCSHTIDMVKICPIPNSLRI
jgi:hypothetical protein